MVVFFGITPNCGICSYYEWMVLAKFLDCIIVCFHSLGDWNGFRELFAEGFFEDFSSIVGGAAIKREQLLRGEVNVHLLLL